VFFFENSRGGNGFLVSVTVHAGKVPVVVGQDLDAVGCDLSYGNPRQGKYEKC
jgi:hypothetical protein